MNKIILSVIAAATGALGLSAALASATPLAGGGGPIASPPIIVRGPIIGGPVGPAPVRPYPPPIPTPVNPGGPMHPAPH